MAGRNIIYTGIVEKAGIGLFENTMLNSVWQGLDILLEDNYAAIFSMMGVMT